MRLWLLTALLVSLSASAGLRDWADACGRAYVRVRYGAYDPGKFSPEELSQWVAAFGPHGEFPSLPIHRLSDPLLWHIYDQLPLSLRKRLEEAPPEVHRLSLFLDAVAERTGSAWSRSFLGNLWDRWQRGPESARPFGDWIRAHRDEPRPAAEVLQGEFDALREEIRASNAWVVGYQMPVPYELLPRSRIRVHWGDHTFEGQVKHGEVILEVPRSRVAHPAWNPLDHANLAAMAQAGLSPPSVYRTELGHDGKFYLQDGNHRFALFGQDPVRVAIGFPPRTAPLRNYLDLRGYPQPTREEIQALYRGELAPIDVLPSHGGRWIEIYPQAQRSPDRS